MPFNAMCRISRENGVILSFRAKNAISHSEKRQCDRPDFARKSAYRIRPFQGVLPSTPWI
jgi:hypothetical protein